jgi:hypothetical protein
MSVANLLDRFAPIEGLDRLEVVGSIFSSAKGELKIPLDDARLIGAQLEKGARDARALLTLTIGQIDDVSLELAAVKRQVAELDAVQSSAEIIDQLKALLTAFEGPFESEAPTLDGELAAAFCVAIDDVIRTLTWQRIALDKANQENEALRRLRNPPDALGLMEPGAVDLSNVVAFRRPAIDAPCDVEQGA